MSPRRASWRCVEAALCRVCLGVYCCGGAVLSTIGTLTFCVRIDAYLSPRMRRLVTFHMNHKKVVPKILEAEQREIDEMRALMDGGV